MKILIISLFNSENNVVPSGRTAKKKTFQTKIDQHNNSFFLLFGQCEVSLFCLYIIRVMQPVVNSLFTAGLAKSSSTSPTGVIPG